MKKDQSKLNKTRYIKAIKAIKEIKLSPADKKALWDRLQKGGGPAETMRKEMRVNLLVRKPAHKRSNS